MKTSRDHLKQLNRPLFHPELCTGCGVCAESCKFCVIEMRAGRPAFGHLERCSYCGDCEDICPQKAIELEYVII